MTNKRKNFSVFKLYKISALYLLFCWITNFSWAQNDQTNQLLQIYAVKLEIDQIKKVAIFSGKVQAKQKDFSLNSAYLKLFYSNNLGDFRSFGKNKDTKIRKMEAYGGVKIQRGQQKIIGDKIDFSPQLETIIVSGKNLNYDDGQTKARACRFIFQRKSNKTILESCPGQEGGVSLKIIP